LERFKKNAGDDIKEMEVIYGGDKNMNLKGVKVKT
jgi:hypothetical protein